MMNEDEYEIYSGPPQLDHTENLERNIPDSDKYPFTISDGIYGNSSKNYVFSLFEIFVTSVIMLSTLSGGYLEGYTSAAIPSLLHYSEFELNHTVPLFNSSDKTYDEKAGNLSSTPEILPTPLPLSEASLSSPPLVITEEEGSWIGSLLLLGAAFGALISSWVVHLGRRYAILISALPRFLGWLLIAVSVNPYALYAGRFISGISVGAISSAAPIYISEIAHPSLRGSLSCIVLLGVNVGMFIAALFGTFLEWRGLAIVGAMTVVFYFFPTLCIPNSPSWLLLRGRESDAKISLRRLRKKGYSVDNEIQQILNVVDTSKRVKSVPWKDLLRERRTLLPMGVVFLVTLINRFSGYNAIITYCTLFIHRVVPVVSEYWSAVAICLVQIVATAGAMMLVDSWGRRKLLLLSVSLMGLSLVSIAILEGIVPGHTGGTWLGVVATMMYICGYSLGIGPLTWVLMGELFPLDARDKASAVISVCNWFMAFLVTKTYFDLESSIGISWTCVLYSSVCLLGGIATFFLVPETKGRSLSEIEAFFSYAQRRTWFEFVRNRAGGTDQALSNIVDQESPESYSTFH